MSPAEELDLLFPRLDDEFLVLAVGLGLGLSW
jgi:hypothetical protein